MEVTKFLKRAAKDPDSITYQDWSEVYKLNYSNQLYWAVDVTYRAKNSFGGMVLESKTFLIRHNQVVDTIDK